jgi:hypothetical protein
MRGPLPAFSPEEYQADIVNATEVLKTETNPKERAILEMRILAAEEYLKSPAPQLFTRLTTRRYLRVYSTLS